ncbi:MAG: type II/IV secretion system ATPase subunit [Candidatus Nanohaloarchaea archaeon]
MTEVKEQYEVMADHVPAQVTIEDDPEEYVLNYKLKRPQPSVATEALLDNVREEVIDKVDINTDQLNDSENLGKTREIFRNKAEELLKEELPETKEERIKAMVGNLIHSMLGLGDVEILLKDSHLEEIVINNSEEPAWVYHKELGWMKTDITFDSEEEIYNYASEIGRGVGKNISSLHPLLDAHLPSGDRTNATISPISTKGNTVTIRKFARDPWTITDFINIGTIDKDVAAFLWLAIQYEMNIIVSGGTGAGKTSLLNVLTPFIPPSQRIVSIEDTREISLPDFLHWVPLTTREANPEGQGEVSMQDLLVNSLRMRPDRILVGEIRRKRQAEVLFEAMQTGHSVYSTLHADTAETTIKRMTNPPIDVPETVVEAVDLNVVMFRDRRRNFRRVLEVAEVLDDEDEGLEPNKLYKWDSKEDEIHRANDSKEIMDKLEMLTGLDQDELMDNLREKRQVLSWMIEKEVDSVEGVGRVVAEYYSHQDKVVEAAEQNKDPSEITREA